MFASEIKALTVHPEFQKKFNEKILPLYLQFQYVPTEETAFCGYADCFRGTLSGTVTEATRWKNILKVHYTTEENTDRPVFFRVSVTLKKVFQRPNEILLGCLNRFQGCEDFGEKAYGFDVEVAAFLSGGVDSGLINAFAGTEKVFTVGFTGEGFDERIYAMKKRRENGRQTHVGRNKRRRFFRGGRECSVLQRRTLRKPERCAIVSDCRRKLRKR